MNTTERVARAIYAANAGKWHGMTWEEAGGDFEHSSTRKAYFREAEAAIEAMGSTRLWFYLLGLALGFVTGIWAPWAYF